VPNYLSSVPVPRTFKGFIDLSVKEWAHLITFSAAAGTTGYFLGKPFYEKYIEKRIFDKKDYSPMNYDIRLEAEKVYDIIDVEDLGEKTNLCRCWRSKKWPFCDGTHNKHNLETGDNVASVIIQNKRKSLKSG